MGVDFSPEFDKKRGFRKGYWKMELHLKYLFTLFYVSHSFYDCSNRRISSNYHCLGIMPPFCRYSIRPFKALKDAIYLLSYY